MSKEELAAVKSTIADYLQKGWIHPSASPYGAPVIVIHKKDGHCASVSTTGYLTNKCGSILTQSRILMSCWIDLQKRGFTPSWTLLQDTTKSGWLLVMSIKRAFLTHYSTYKWLVLPLGLTNALAMFQKLMNSIF